MSTTPDSTVAPLNIFTPENLASEAKSTASAAQGLLNKSFDSLQSLTNAFSSPGGPSAGKPINVLQFFRWTLSDISAFVNEIPAIILREFKCEESVVRKQLNLYTKITNNTLNNLTDIFNKKNSSGETKVEDVYENVWSTKNPTNFVYTFPYYNQQAFSLSTQEWTSLESVGDHLKNMIRKVPLVGETVADAADLAETIATLAMQTKFQHVGVIDRPRLFASHANRSINISFPLYNTVKSTDWIIHRTFIQNLMLNNLYYKRDYVTGVPPVFYQVTIPGQYFCWAACMTDISVKNLGNVRKINGEIVPDAYQVDLTLNEMVMPSKNQFTQATKGNPIVNPGTSLLADIAHNPFAASSNNGINSTSTRNIDSDTVIPIPVPESDYQSSIPLSPVTFDSQGNATN